MNKCDEEFGEQRLIAWLLASANAPAAGQVRDIIRALAAFTGAARQQDDITCLLLRAA